MFRPVAIGFGEGSELRQPLGITLVAGLALSQLLTLFTTPVIYLAFERIWGGQRPRADDADPVDASRRGDRSVGLDRDLEALRVQGLDQRGVELQHGLAPTPPNTARSTASPWRSIPTARRAAGSCPGSAPGRSPTWTSRRRSRSSW